MKPILEAESLKKFSLFESRKSRKFFLDTSLSLQERFGALYNVQRYNNFTYPGTPPD